MPINHRTRQAILDGVRKIVAKTQAVLDAEIDRDQIYISEQDCEDGFVTDVVDSIGCEIEGAFTAEDPE
jgi:hypothetical protein